MSDYTVEGTPPVVNMAVEGAARVALELQTLLSTPVGSQALDRDFGLDWSLLDRPLPEAMAALRVEIIEKVRRYIPLIHIKEIDFVETDADRLGGRMIPVVRFSLAE